MTDDTWHVTCDTWHVTPDTWHVTSMGRWTFSQNFCSLVLVQNFRFSKHRPSGPMLSISRFVHMCVCLSVCLSVCLFVHFLRYRLNIFLPPLPEVGCLKILEIRNPCGKVMERSGLKFEHFCLNIYIFLIFLIKFFLSFFPWFFFDMWQVTGDTWHVTHDTGCGVNILSKFQLSSSDGLGITVYWTYWD